MQNQVEETPPAPWRTGSKRDSDSIPLVASSGDPPAQALAVDRLAGADETTAQRRAPTHVFVILFVAIWAVSSAATIFALMSEVSALCRATWRLIASSAVMLPFAAAQWRRLSPTGRKRFVAPRVVGVLAASGACLGLHFGFWVWSIDHTSIAHSLLFVSTSPLILVVAALIIRQPISRGEIGAAVVAFAGVGIVSLDVKSDRAVSWEGDLSAFLGAVAVTGYLVAGRFLRSWVPIFVYAFPVTLIGALLLSVLAAVFEGESAGYVWFGWCTSSYAGYVVYLAIGPGIAGHTGLNYTLRYLNALHVSVATMAEPLLGTVIGWAAGVGAAPGIWTSLGGPVLVGGLVWMTISAARREAAATSAVPQTCE